MRYPTRVKPVDFGSLSQRQEAIRVKMGPYGEEGTSAMMRTFLNYPEFVRSIGRIGTRVTLTSDLPKPLAALASLRTTWLCDCEYLWAQIRQEALGGRITEAQVGAIAAGEYDALTSIERHLVEAIDEMHDTHYLSEEKWYRVGLLGPNAVMDLMTTYGFFVTLSAAVNSMGVEFEDTVPGWGVPRPASVSANSGRTPLREIPKRVFEADYSLLSPQQIEQANRMGRRGKPTTSKLQKAMINYPDFLRSMSPFGKRAIDDSCLPPRVWQLAAMRTVWLCDSEYLWSQHRKACLQLGVTDEDLRGVAEGPRSTALNDFDRVIVSTVDDMYHHNRISDENWSQFDQFGPEGITDLILTYGLYVLQSCLARSFGTTLEENTLGYAPELEAYRDGQHRRASHV
ncbi:carboxymuconolactone decarboxylase family protein [Dactylosporangium sp. CA-092794]|uniref:carboxymuconolactone decarboxylase family protein n=1 Tax=Dactylosporangium sp. CA-092794 TaxID=3239929 RepID=UPI003D8B33AD